MAGALGGMCFAQLVSRILQCTNNNYAVPFAVASLAYLVALAVMHALVPRLERMEVST
jgi:ACS family hexuronate transporter-like MFS transporter